MSCPYKGLVPFAEADADFFFGRESDQHIITDNLMAARLTLLYGASGVGKSSVLYAGVRASLRDQSRRNAEHYGELEYAVVVFKSWRDDPLEGLMRRVELSVQDAWPCRSFERPPEGRELVEFLRHWTGQFGGELLIILDQFEEYFVYHGDEDETGTFAVEFPRAVNEPGLRVNFLVSMREDTLAKLDRFKGIIPGLFDNRLHVDHLSHEAARRAIVGPLEQYNKRHAAEGSEFQAEPELVDEVLKEVKAGRVVLGQSGRAALLDGDSDSATSPSWHGSKPRTFNWSCPGCGQRRSRQASASSACRRSGGWVGPRASSRHTWTTW